MSDSDNQFNNIDQGQNVGGNQGIKRRDFLMMVAGATAIGAAALTGSPVMAQSIDEESDKILTEMSEQLKNVPQEHIDLVTEVNTVMREFLPLIATDFFPLAGSLFKTIDFNTLFDDQVANQYEELTSIPFIGKEVNIAIPTEGNVINLTFDINPVAGGPMYLNIKLGSDLLIGGLKVDYPDQFSILNLIPNISSALAERIIKPTNASPIISTKRISEGNLHTGLNAELEIAVEQRFEDNSEIIVVSASTSPTYFPGYGFKTSASSMSIIRNSQTGQIQVLGDQLDSEGKDSLNNITRNLANQIAGIEG